MAYIARWRMKVAFGWLSEGDMTAGEAARRLGYQSESAFNRTFKRLMGVPPGSIRIARKSDSLAGAATA